MKLNWGHKLILVFLLFGGMMSTLVYKSVKTNYDLVSKEYYKDEIAYQQVIDGTALSNKLDGKLEVFSRDEEIIVQLPEAMKNEEVNGTVWFYYAPDAKRDRKIDLTKREQAIPSSLFAPGSYLVKVNWESKGLRYYSEKKFQIQ